MLNKEQLQKNVKTKEIDEGGYGQELAYFMTNWQDSPDWLSGWRHNYFCDHDGTFLEFKLNSPKEHTCPTCGKVYTDRKKNNAWVTIMRNKVIANMRYATLLYFKTDNQDYLTFVKKTLLFYARHYLDFDIHLKNTVVKDMSEYQRVQKDIKEGKVYFDPKVIDWEFTGYHINFQGPGRLMGQGLSDAVALIRLMFCYELLKSDFTVEEQAVINTQLLVPAMDFLDVQQFVTHNITFWREAAIQIMAVINGSFQSEDLSRPFGIYQHLDTCLTAEGMWYEGSIHYHFYVAEALAYLSFFLTNYGIKDRQLEKYLEKMLQFAFDYSFDNGILPNPNDGWPNVNLKTYLQVFELATASYPDNVTLRGIYQHVLGLDITRRALPIEDERYTSDYSSIGMMILPKEEMIETQLTKDSINFPDTKVALIKNDVFNVFFKYGVQSLSHAHYDPLTMEISVDKQLISKDLSNAGYGSDLVRTLYNTVFAHNSIALNNQKPNILYDVSVDKQNEHELKVTSANIYEDAVISREVALLGTDKLLVTTEISCLEEQVIDLTQHFDYCQVELARDYRVSKIQPEAITGYQFTSDIVKECYQLEPVEELHLVDKKNKLKIAFQLKDTEIFVLETVGNPSVERRFSLLFRKQSKNSVLKMMIEKESKE